MTHGAHNHSHPHDHSHEPKGPWWKHVHRDWRFWGIVLMIVALAIYVFTSDLSWLPGGIYKAPTPAAP